MAFVSLLVFTGPAWAISIPGPIDVGSIDILIDSADLGNSGDQTELDWVNDVLNTSFTAMEKYSVMNWVETDTDGVYAIDFKSEEPTYFFIKTGNTLESGFDHFLYQNIASLNWGIIDLLALGVEVDRIGVVSHIGELGGETTQIPEPTTLLLLGLGLVGLAGLRRKL